MGEVNAIIGGEGNGGVIYPKINTARDSLVGITLILELMAERNKKISEIVAQLPKYVMKKEKFNLPGDVSNLYTTLKGKFPETNQDELDGLRLDFPDGSWAHIRPSNTEPVVRIFGEAKTEERVNTMLGDIKLTLGLK